MKTAIYAGTFDPITYGHLDVLKQALNIFDCVEVTIAVNLEKKTIFSLAERIALIEACTQAWEGISVTTFEGLLVNHAKNRGVAALVRGLRQVSDFDYEIRMALANRALEPSLTSVFFMPNNKQLITSSSLVKEIWRWGGDITTFVPLPVQEALAQKNPDDFFKP